jgi:DNA-binding transcriptional LysR family regulator
MINLPLKKIQTLVHLAGTRSFGRTAQALNISQPAVSAHIRDLEAQLDVALVHRTTRQVTLTREGESFAARAARAIAELDMATRDLREISETHRGLAVVACIPPLMSAVIPEVICQLEQRYPEVEIRLLDVLSSGLDDLVIRGEADFGVGPRSLSKDVEFEYLKRDYFVAAVSRGHELAQRRDVTLSELVQYPLIANSRDANARQIVDRAMLRLRKPVKPRYELVHYYSVGAFVEAGLGVTILPRMAFRGLSSNNVIALPIRSPRVYRDIGLIRRPEYRLSPTAIAFITVMKSVMHKAPGEDGAALEARQ